MFTLIPAAEIRALREESPSNLATLCYKAVEKLVTAAETGAPSQREQQTGEEDFLFRTDDLFLKQYTCRSVILLKHNLVNRCTVYYESQL